MSKFRYQEGFGQQLAESWIKGDREYVRTTIRNLKNKAQAAYIAAYVVQWLAESGENSLVFVAYMHPNNS